MFDMREFTTAIGEILADIEFTYDQIGKTDSVERKRQLMRHIQKQQRKIRALNKEYKNED